jgi:hypothetical protein
MNSIFEKIFTEGERPSASMFIRSVDDDDCLRTYNALLEKNMTIYGTQAEFRVLHQKIKRIKNEPNNIIPISSIFPLGLVDRTPAQD